MKTKEYYLEEKNFDVFKIYGNQFVLKLELRKGKVGKISRLFKEKFILWKKNLINIDKNLSMFEEINKFLIYMLKHFYKTKNYQKILKECKKRKIQGLLELILCILKYDLMTHKNHQTFNELLIEVVYEELIDTKIKNLFIFGIDKSDIFDVYEDLIKYIKLN